MSRAVACRCSVTADLFHGENTQSFRGKDFSFGRTNPKENVSYRKLGKHKSTLQNNQSHSRKNTLCQMSVPQHEEQNTLHSTSVPYMCKKYTVQYINPTVYFTKYTVQYIGHTAYCKNTVYNTSVPQHAV